MSLQDDLFFAIMGTGRNPDLTTRGPLATQRDGAGGELRGNGNIELQAPRYRKLVAFQAQRDKARRVLFVLRGNQRNFAQQAAHKFTQLAVTFRRAL